jgi:hypothetical protein
MPKALRPFVLALGFWVVLTGTASAQLAVGLTGGVNSATLTGSSADSINVSSKTGGAGGLYANIYLGKRFSIEGQLLFAGQGFEANGVAVTQGYIQLPALLKVYFGNFNLFVGPSVNWQVSCSADAASSSATCDTANTSLWNGIAGAGLQFGRLGAEVHYSSGFSDTFDNVNASYGVWSLMGRFAILGSR